MSDRGLKYDLRRKAQVIAYNLTKPEVISKIYFKHELRYKLDLKDPKSFNEKIQWLKLYEWPNNELAIKCTDKYRVRKYIKEKNMQQYLNELLGVWDNAYDIDFNQLPEKFVLKCNHGCGYNIIVKDKSKINFKKIRKTLNKWMKEDFGKYNAEPHYSRIKRKIICEKFLEGEVINYNIYVFNGKAIFLSVAGGLGEGIEEHLTYYNIDGSLANFKNLAYPVKKEQLTQLLPKMIEVAEKFGEDFPMVRVDLYDIQGKIVLSELTFTPGGGIIKFDPKEADFALGKKLNIDLERRKYEKD